MKGYINIIRLSGKIHICPDLHEDKDKALESLSQTLGNYRTPHIQFVTEPILIEVKDEAAVS